MQKRLHTSLIEKNDPFLAYFLSAKNSFFDNSMIIPGSSCLDNRDSKIFVLGIAIDKRDPTTFWVNEITDYTFSRGASICRDKNSSSKESNQKFPLEAKKRLCFGWWEAANVARSFLLQKTKN